ncbi:hypothetical protein SASPL_134458 [Salvia splendens]|uniref:Uncharacterized protein n=1 Tax=Salvia splendens TaxID=180675 RepID=A0A8X8ZIX2_SALSN|nr:uncharacterized protein LOC121757267 isoform X2 [Salvia splendens]KAG6406847.1 hypothetical protein SASPL_134458 [Salvia splendens]
MASAAASALTPFNSPLASSKSQLHQLRNPFLINIPKKHISVSCFAKLPEMEHFNNPSKLVVMLSNAQKKLWNMMPDSVKQFPWKKAETVALEEFLALVKEALKWYLLAYFAFSCLSDISYSISRNKELVIPLGLFVGIMTTKLFDEISRELMPDHQDGRFTWRLPSIAVFFVLVKAISTYLPGVNHLLMHAANGGLMQVLWNWKDIQKHDGDESSSDGSSSPVDAGN